MDRPSRLKAPACTTASSPSSRTCRPALAQAVPARSLQPSTAGTQAFLAAVDKKDSRAGGHASGRRADHLRRGRRHRTRDGPQSSQDRGDQAAGRCLGEVHGPWQADHPEKHWPKAVQAGRGAAHVAVVRHQKQPTERAICGEHPDKNGEAAATPTCISRGTELVTGGDEQDRDRCCRHRLRSRQRLLSVSLAPRAQRSRWRQGLGQAHHPTGWPESAHRPRVPGAGGQRQGPEQPGQYGRSTALRALCGGPA